MNIASWIVIALVAAWLILAVLRIVRRKGSCGCGGSCGACGGNCAACKHRACKSEQSK